LFFINIFVSLIFYSGLLLLAVRKNLQVREMIHMSALRFFIAVVCVIIAITIIVSFVDYYLVTQPRHLDGIHGYFGTDISGIYRVVSLDLVNWALALVMIFMSVMILSMVVLKLNLHASMMVASGMALVNEVFWSLIGIFGDDVPILTIIFGILVSPVIVRALILWYANERFLGVRAGAETDHPFA